MKIVYLSAEYPDNYKLWSGTISSMYNTLKSRYEVEAVFVPYYKYIRLFFAAASRFIEMFIKGKIVYTHTDAYSRLMGFIMSVQLRKKEYDFVFAPCLSTTVEYVKTGKPIITLDDAAFDDLVDYYKYFSNVNPKNLKKAKEKYANCCKRSDIMIYASEWAKNGAVKRYGIEDKTFVLRFGANFKSLPANMEIRKKKSAVINILFVGVNWETKGGPILIEAYNFLKKNGRKVKLTIIGCNPEIVDKDIEIIPFLSKQNEDDIRRFHSKYSEADFFMLPTRFECAGIVFCEASAFGVPILATDTGGVKSYVEDGVNGYCLPYEAGGEEYAAKLIGIYSDEAMYMKLRQSAREKFEKELNWQSWLDGFDKIINNYKNH